jgi:hypothetical protein
MVVLLPSRPSMRVEPPLVAAPVPPEGDAPRATSGAGEVITRRFFELCENPRTRELMMRRLGASARSAVGGRLLFAAVTRLVFRPLLRSRRLDVAAARFELVAAQLGGIAVLRYVTRMEPIASMPVDDLVAMVAPGIQATLGRPAAAQRAGSRT